MEAINSDELDLICQEKEVQWFDSFELMDEFFAICKEETKEYDVTVENISSVSNDDASYKKILV